MQNENAVKTSGSMVLNLKETSLLFFPFISANYHVKSCSAAVVSTRTRAPMVDLLSGGTVWYSPHRSHHLLSSVTGPGWGAGGWLGRVSWKKREERSVGARRWDVREKREERDDNNKQHQGRDQISWQKHEITQYYAILRSLRRRADVAVF